MNGDVTSAEVLQMLNFGQTTDETALKIDGICADINADVNMRLANLGFAAVTTPFAIGWVALTKKFGAASLAIDMLMAQDTEEENTRAERFWARYKSRLQELEDSGGGILSDPTDTATVLTTAPVSPKNSRRSLRAARFPQSAVITHRDNEQKLLDDGVEGIRQW